jgi:anti-sigma factor RsiW
MKGPMSDLTSSLTDEEMAELSALADGTLPVERRAAVEARVAASPELRALVARQRRALAASRAAASEQPPASLRASVEALVRPRRAPRGRRRRLVPRLAMGSAVGVAAVIALVVALSGGPSGPSVADAARLATLPPTGPAPARLDSSQAMLSARVDGVVFPDLRRRYGWKPVGVRHGRVDGQRATVVYYAKGGKRIAYAIVSGPGLPKPSEGRATVRGGVEYRALRLEGRPAVTWRRLGHTCVLIGPAPRGELVALASWRGGGALRY